MICSNCINQRCECVKLKAKNKKKYKGRHNDRGQTVITPIRHTAHATCNFDILPDVSHSEEKIGCPGCIQTQYGEYGQDKAMETTQPRRAAGGSPGSSKVTVPFYATPTYCKKTSAEIISEARAAIIKGSTSAPDMTVSNPRVTAAVRPVNTKRPFTPRERQRTLFGSSSKRSSWRPPSSFSLGYLQFQETDNQSTTPPHLRRLNPLPLSPSSSLNSSLNNSDSATELASWRAQLAGDGQQEEIRAISTQTPILTLYGSSASMRLKLPSIGAAGGRKNPFRSAASLDNLPEELEGEENENSTNNSYREVPPPRKAYSSPVQRTRTIEINLEEECFADIENKDACSPTPNKRSLTADALSQEDGTHKVTNKQTIGADGDVINYKSDAWREKHSSSANSKKIKPNENSDGSISKPKAIKDTKSEGSLAIESLGKRSENNVKDMMGDNASSEFNYSVLLGGKIKSSMLTGLSPEVAMNTFGLNIENKSSNDLMSSGATAMESDMNQKSVSKTSVHKPKSDRSRPLITASEEALIGSEFGLKTHISNKGLGKTVDTALPVSPNTLYLSNADESIIKRELRPTSQDSLRDEVIPKNLDDVNTLVDSTIKSNAWLSEKPTRKKPDNYKPARPFSSEKNRKANRPLEETKSVEDPILGPIHRAMQENYTRESSKQEIKSLRESEVDLGLNFGQPIVEHEKRNPIQEQLDTLNEFSLRTGNDIEVIITLSKLYKTLESEHAIGTNIQNPKLKALVLKTLYKFVERSNETLLLQIARVILAFRVTGSNLSGVCKLIFKVSRCDKNDKLFLEDNILELFVEALGSASPLEDAEACVYGYGALKFLTMNNVLLSRVLGLGTLELMVLHMKIVSTARAEGSRIPEQTSHAMFQLTGALRNVAGEELMFPQFVTKGAVIELCRAMEFFSSDLDVISNVSRTLSIISTHDDCCNAIVEYENCFRLFVKLFQKYPGRQDIIVRLGYALGNLMAKSDDARTKFYGEEGAVSSMLNLLTIYLEKDLHIQGLENNQTISSDAGSSGSVEDVIVKMIRILANMSINPMVGGSLTGANPTSFYNENNNGGEESEDALEAVRAHKNGGRFLDVLLTVLQRRSVGESEELTHSVLSTLNNLSYYPTCADGAFGERQLEIAKELSSMLSSERKESVVEALRVFGNLTRSQDTRDYLLESGGFSQLLKFLDQDDRELLCTAAGILVNMMADWDKRVALKEGNGIHRLTKVLTKFGEGDWQLATLICQALWNYCIESTNLHTAFGIEETNELLGVLADYLDEERLFGVVEGTEVNEIISSSLNYQLWEEFAGVATNLLEKIDTFLDSLEPLETITLTNDTIPNTDLEVIPATEEIYELDQNGE